jgi:hypothetical protein
MTIADKILLRKRPVIETVNNELKNICQVEHMCCRFLHDAYPDKAMLLLNFLVI